jgi:hypothetical protein
VDELKEAPLQGRFLPLPTNIILSWKDLPGTNTLAYYEYWQRKDLKSFITFGPNLLGKVFQDTQVRLKETWYARQGNSRV